MTFDGSYRLARWSKSGQYIATVRHTADSSDVSEEIWIISADGLVRRKTLQFVGGSAMYPPGINQLDWLENDRRILLSVRYPIGSTRFIIYEYAFYLISTETETVIVFNQAGDDCPCRLASYPYESESYFDGVSYFRTLGNSWLVATRQEYVGPLETFVLDFRGRLILASADFSSITPVATDCPIDRDQGLSDHPAMSPDQRMLVYVCDRSSLHILDLATGDDGIIYTAPGTPSIWDDSQRALAYLDWSPNGQQLVFSMERPHPLVTSEEGAEIWVVNRDGTGLALLTSGQKPSWQPAPAAPAPTAPGWIAYEGSDNNIHLTTSDGGRQLQVTSDAAPAGTWAGIHYGSPQWSPAGRLLAFIRRDYGSDDPTMTLMVYDLDSGSSQELLDQSVFHGYDWRPDSAAIIYSRPIDNWGPDGGPAEPIYGLWQLELASGQAAELVPPPGRPLVRPRWSPDGRYLAFQEVRYMEGAGDFAVQEPGTGAYYAWNGPVGRFSWSPDGAFLVYDGIFYVGPGRGLWRADPAGGRRQQLTFPDTSVGDAGPLVAPSGNLIAFSRGPAEPFFSQGSAPWLVGTDGSGLRQLVELTGEPQWPVEWSPDGRFLLTQRWSGNSGLVQLIEVASGQTWPLAGGSFPNWQPVPPAPLSEPWLAEKSQLIDVLSGELLIPTDLYPVAIPFTQAFDETAAQALTGRVRAAAEAGDLTQEQLDAYARLVLQERSFSQILPAHAEIAATVADAGASTVETTLGLVFVLKPAWNRCREAIPFCGRIQQATEQLAWRLVTDAGQIIIQLAGGGSSLGQAGSTMWDLLVRLVEDGFAQGKSLQELLFETAIQAAGTAAMVELHYLGPSQPLLEKGVATADLEQPAGESWPITGSLEGAEIIASHYAEQTAIHQELALDRQQDFQRGAEILEVAEDIADLALASPAALIAGGVAIGARLEHIFLVNLPLAIWNLRELECVRFLSDQGAGQVFDVEQPLLTCSDRAESRAPERERAALIARPPAASLQAQALAAAAGDYRQAAEALQAAGDGQDLVAFELALDRLIAADGALAAQLDQAVALTLADQTATAAAEEMIALRTAVTARTMGLYLASAGAIMANQDGQDVGDELGTAIQPALEVSTAVEQAAGQGLPAPPERPLLLISDIRQEPAAGQGIVLTVGLANVGRAADPAAEVRVLDAGGALLARQPVEPLGPESAGQLAFNLPGGGGLWRVELVADGLVQDVAWLSPAGQSALPAADLTPAEQEPAGPVAGFPLAWLAAGLASLAIGLGLLGYVLLVWRRGRLATAVVRPAACPHCCRPHPARAKFCPTTGRPL